MPGIFAYSNSAGVSRIDAEVVRENTQLGPSLISPDTVEQWIF
jgi:hypothetical protein